jgi:hypothetical protein
MQSLILGLAVVIGIFATLLLYQRKAVGVSLQGKESACVVILRCARKPGHALLTEEAVSCIRKHNLEIPIYIVDDHSTIPVSEVVHATATVVPSNLPPGRGEILPYEFLLRYQWADRALIIHDSVFINYDVRALIDRGGDFSPLWTAGHFKDYAVRPEIEAELNALAHNYSARYKNPSSWDVVFGGMAVVSARLVKRIDARADLSKLLDYIDTRDRRKGFERVLGIMVREEFDHKPRALLGDIFQDQRWGRTYEDYLLKKKEHQGQVVKVWSGR